MIDEIKNDLKDILTEFRYEHSLLTAIEAKDLASYYNIDSDKAYLAGLVHDIAKDLSIDQVNYYIDKYNIKDFDNYEDVLHAEIGYYIVKEKYNLDEDICNSVRYHSLGNIDMTLFDKIIFIADKIGRSNRNKDLENVKLMAYKDIDSAIMMCLEYVKNKLDRINKPFHNESKKLLELLNKKDGIK